jgi:tetratricopeptide (TPR) repeat protein/O-antigen ligase
LAGLVVPLAFHTLGTLGFESTKVLLVRLLALALLIGWLCAETLRIRATPGPFAWRGSLRAAWNGPLRLVAMGLVVYAVANVVATVASLTPLVSLLGSWDRQQGLATTLAWLVLGIAAAVIGRDNARRTQLLRIWVLASVPVCLYAAVQFAHLDPVSWLNQPLGVASTLGSSTALATYLAMMVPLTVACLVLAAPAIQGRPSAPRARTKGAWWTDPRLRFGGLAAMLTLQVAALLMTQVRGGLLALAGGVLVMVAFAGWPTHRRQVVMGGTIAAILLVLGSALLAAVPRPDVGDGEDTSARQRVLIWQDAVQALAGPRMLIGYGPETQPLSLEPHFPVELALRFENQRFDRAHNLVFDTLLTTGLFGLVGLVMIVYGVVRAAVWGSVVERGPGRWVPAGILGALAANLIAGQFAFDTAATGVLFWLLAGLAASPLVPGPAAALLPPARRPTRRERREQPAAGLTPAVRVRATAMLAAAAIGLSTVPWLTATFLADLYHTRALALRAGEAPGSSSRQEVAAVQAVPWLDVPVLALADTFLDLARTTTLESNVMVTTFDDLFTVAPSSRAALFEGARLSLERAITINPLDPYPHAAMARHWVMRAEASRDAAEQVELYGRAVESFDNAIAAGPSRVGFYDEAGVALTRWGRPTLALERFKQADALSKPTAERLTRVADAMLAPGDIATARTFYERALALDNRSAPAEAGLARLDRSAGNLSGALEHASRAARFQMRNWQYHRDLALIQRELGMNGEALVSARTARRLAPAWELDELTALIQSVSG